MSCAYNQYLLFGIYYGYKILCLFVYEATFMFLGENWSFSKTICFKILTIMAGMLNSFCLLKWDQSENLYLRFLFQKISPYVHFEEKDQNLGKTICLNPPSVTIQ